MKHPVEPNHYFYDYDTKGRFVSYWHQVNEIIKLGPKNVLEIGIGNGFISKYLRERKVKIVTLDIDERLMPDIVGSVLNIPFPDFSFDAIACYEVLEHLPYENFDKALSELFRVSNTYTLLSLPAMNRAYRFNLQIPKLGDIRVLIPFPRFGRGTHKFAADHCWEIGGNDYPLSKIIADIKKVGFHIVRTYRVFEFPHHRFFVLKRMFK